MTFYACPICGKEPEIRCFDELDCVYWRARCWCTTEIGKSEDDLRRRWNNLYCSNDPATGRDCL